MLPSAETIHTHSYLSNTAWGLIWVSLYCPRILRHLGCTCRNWICGWTTVACISSNSPKTGIFPSSWWTRQMLQQLYCHLHFDFQCCLYEVQKMQILVGSELDRVDVEMLMKLSPLRGRRQPGVSVSADLFIQLHCFKDKKQEAVHSFTYLTNVCFRRSEWMLRLSSWWLCSRTSQRWTPTRCVLG